MLYRSFGTAIGDHGGTHYLFGKVEPAEGSLMLVLQQSLAQTNNPVHKIWLHAVVNSTCESILERRLQDAARWKREDAFDPVRSSAGETGDIQLWSRHEFQS